MTLPAALRLRKMQMAYVYISSRTGLFGQISFRDLQQWLLESGLNLDIAFALDGGRSTMLYVAR